MQKSFFLINLFLISIFTISATEKDTTKFTIYSWKLSENYTNIKKFDIDTSLNNLHIYNPIYKNNLQVHFLGNLGQAYTTKLFFQKPKKNFFVFNENFLNYSYNNEDFNYYHTDRPFSKFHYTSNGTKNKSEQSLNILHTQNINENLNVGIKANLLSSEGMYLQQNTKNYSFAFFSSYLRNNYTLHFHTFINKLELNESGGKVLGVSVISPRLNDFAYTILNNKSVSLTQSIKFNKKDSIEINDSTKKLIYIPRGKLFHHFSINRNYKTFREQGEKNDTLIYYPHYLYHNDTTIDSTFVFNMSNQIAYEFVNDSIKKTHIFAKHDYINQVYNVFGNVKKIDKEFSNISFGLFFQRRFKNNFTFSTSFDYYTWGYKKSDFNFKLNFTKQINKVHNFSFDLINKNNEAVFFYKFYHSNHFLWYNTDLKKEKEKKIHFHYENTKRYFKIGFNISELENFIYLNEEARAKQNQNKFKNFHVFLEKKFSFYKFRFINQIHFQYSKADSILHLPKFLSYHSFFYENIFLENDIIKVQLGIDCSFNTPYYLPKYSPDLSQFYLQNEEKSTYLPKVDVFANFKIKRFTFFFKYFNVLSFVETDQFSVVNYPLNEGGFRTGLLWNFYN